MEPEISTVNEYLPLLRSSDRIFCIGFRKTRGSYFPKRTSVFYSQRAAFWFVLIILARRIREAHSYKGKPGDALNLGG